MVSRVVGGLEVVGGLGWYRVEGWRSRVAEGQGV